MKLNHYIFILIAFMASCQFIGCKNQKNNSKEIVIATSANMQSTMHELANQFTKETGVQCQLVISSSGKLTAQIKEGAPYDIFVSADMKYPQEVYKFGQAYAPPKVYAYGKLVLWTMIEGLEPALNEGTFESIGHFAIANPKTAPYGIAAIEVLTKKGLFENAQDKLVYGESISQTNQFIMSRSADMGLTALAVVLSPRVKGKGQWLAIDQELYNPIQQGVVRVKREKNATNDAEAFYDFLFSDAAREILKNFGYSVDE